MAHTGYRQKRSSELSPRQREVLALIARGMTNFEIAERLGISLDGAKFHVREIFARLGVDSREEAARVWRQERSFGSRMRRLGGALFAPRPLLIGGLGLAALAIGGIGVAVVGLRGNNGEPPAAGANVTPEGTPTITTTPSASATPATSSTPGPAELPGWEPAPSTGLQELDAIVDALLSGDERRIGDLIAYGEYPCEAPRSVQPQPLVCRDGMTPGDVLTGIFVSHVEGAFLGPDEAPARLANDFGSGTRLYGAWAYEASADGSETADHGLVFTRFAQTGEVQFDTVQVRNGRIIGVDYAFPDTIVIDMPLAPQWTLAPPSSTGGAFPVADREFFELAKAVETDHGRHDTTRLTRSVVLEHVVCTEEMMPPQFVDSPPCEFVGDEFDMFVVGTGSHGGQTRVEPGDVVAPWDVLLAGDANRSDAWGNGEVRLHALRKMVNGETGETQYGMLLTAIVPPGTLGNEEAIRIGQEVFWEKRDGEWVIPWMTWRPIVEAEMLRAEQEGGWPPAAGWEWLLMKPVRCFAGDVEWDGDDWVSPSSVAFDVGEDALDGIVAQRKTDEGIVMALPISFPPDVAPHVSIMVEATNGSAVGLTHPDYGNEPRQRITVDTADLTVSNGRAFITGDLVAEQGGCIGVYVELYETAGKPVAVAMLSMRLLPPLR